MNEILPNIFDILYDLKTKEELEHEVEYLLHRLQNIRRLCKNDFPDVVKYIDSFGNKENT